MYYCCQWKFSSSTSKAETIYYQENQCFKEQRKNIQTEKLENFPSGENQDIYLYDR